VQCNAAQRIAHCKAGQQEQLDSGQRLTSKRVSAEANARLILRHKPASGAEFAEFAAARTSAPSDVCELRAVSRRRRGCCAAQTGPSICKADARQANREEELEWPLAEQTGAEWFERSGQANKWAAS